MNAQPKENTWVDIGVNLTNSQFKEDHQKIITNAIAANVTQMIVIGTDLKHSQAAIDLCQSWPHFLYCTVGLHPHEARCWQSNYRYQLLQLAQQAPVKAIGETGLDFNRNYSSQADQIKAFEAQLELACELELPLFLHERDAAKTFTPILKEYRNNIERFTVHCFTGSKETLFNYLDLGAWIGITGWICDDRRGQNLFKILPSVPLDRLMIETDAPFLLPKDLNPKPQSHRNEPCYLPHIGRKVAHAYQVSTETIQTHTTANARHFFSLT